MQTHIATPQGLPPSLNTIIRVNRAERPRYFDGVGGEGLRVMHPELESTGPAEYDLANLQVVPHGSDGSLTVDGVYNTVKNRKGVLGLVGFRDTSAMGLSGCLGVADGRAILEKGIEVFDAFFPGKVLWLLRSIVEHHGVLMAPCIFRTSESARLAIDWYRLYTRASRRSVTAHFPR